MKKLAAVLMMSSAMGVAPFAIVTPAANAEICAGTAGRHVAIGGCTNVAGDIARGVAIASQDYAYFPGEIPCYTVEGVPYYTPPGDPC